MSSSFQLDFLPTFFFFARLLSEFVDLLISDSASLAASSPFSFHIHSQLMECFHQRVCLRSMIHHQLALRRMKFRSHEHFFAKPPCYFCHFWCHFILVPGATRLRMSLTSSPGRTKKFEVFHWLTKNRCAAEMKITKLYASHVTSGPDGGWRATKKMQNKWRPFLIDPKES